MATGLNLQDHAVLHKMQLSAEEQHEKINLHLWGTQRPSKDNRGHECTSMEVNIDLQINENRWLTKAMTLSRNWVNTKKTRNQRSEPQYFIGRDEVEQRGKAPRRQMGSASVHSVSCRGSLSKYKKKSNDQLSSKTSKGGTIKTTTSQGSPLGLRSRLSDKHFLQPRRRLGFHLQLAHWQAASVQH